MSGVFILPIIGIYILSSFGLAFLIEVGLRIINKRTITKQTHMGFIKKLEDEVNQVIEKNNQKLSDYLVCLEHNKE